MEKREFKKVESDRISNDMLAEVFSRVSVKVLVRLKCLSTSMASFIDDPTFIDFYRSKVEAYVVTPYVRERRDYNDLEFFSVNSIGVATHMFTSDEFYGDRSCNLRFCEGLICFVNFCYFLCVSDPSTNQSLLLPTPNAVNPYSIDFKFEFGFDPSSEKYKVLIWILGTYREEYEIITVGESSWRPLTVTEPGCALLGSQHVCVNGMVYFSGSDGIDMYAFNLASEVFIKIRRPDKFSHSSCSYVMELREPWDLETRCLCLIDIELHPSEGIFDIWMLSKQVQERLSACSFIGHYEATVEQSWVVMGRRIPMSMPLPLPPEFRDHVPFYVGSGEILLGSTHHQEEEQYHDMYLYCLVRKQFHTRKVVGIPTRDFAAVDYVEE